MPLKRIANCGQHGIISDPEPHMLPENAFTDGKNVRFREGRAEKFSGHSLLANTTGTPYWSVLTVIGGTLYMLYASKPSGDTEVSQVFSWDGTTHTDVTNTTDYATGYTGGVGDMWNGGVINGIPILNNGKDAPQCFKSTDLESLVWYSTNTWKDKGYTAKVLRPWREFVFALQPYVDPADGASPSTFEDGVMWSDRATGGAEPLDWRLNQSSNSAGLNLLSDTPGACIDGLSLRDHFMVYKEDAMWLLTRAGASEVFNFLQVSKTTGMLAPRCAAEFYGRHFVVAHEDIVENDGQQVRSLVDARTRKAIFRRIDPDNHENSFVVPHLGKHEMWFCHPSPGSTLCDLAEVWNWRENTWGVRELPNVTHIGYGLAPDPQGGGLETWADLGTLTWGEINRAWNERTYDPSRIRLYMLGADSGDSAGGLP